MKRNIETIIHMNYVLQQFHEFVLQQLNYKHLKQNEQ